MLYERHYFCCESWDFFWECPLGSELSQKLVLELWIIKTPLFQLIDLSESWGEDVLSEPSTTTPLPTGFVLQIQIYNSWGDPFYVGLNELTLFDETGTVMAMP